MKSYLANYDYHKERDYTAIYDLMAGLGAVRLLQSCWLVSGDFTAPQLRDAMTRCGDGDESFAVLELAQGTDWATLYVPNEGWQWLSANVTQAA